MLVFFAAIGEFKESPLHRTRTLGSQWVELGLGTIPQFMNPYLHT